MTIPKRSRTGRQFSRIRFSLSCFSVDSTSLGSRRVRGAAVVEKKREKEKKRKKKKKREKKKKKKKKIIKMNKNKDEILKY